MGLLLLAYYYGPLNMCLLLWAYYDVLISMGLDKFISKGTKFISKGYQIYLQGYEKVSKGTKILSKGTKFLSEGTGRWAHDSPTSKLTK